MVSFFLSSCVCSFVCCLWLALALCQPSHLCPCLLTLPVHPPCLLLPCPCALFPCAGGPDAARGLHPPRLHPAHPQCTRAAGAQAGAAGGAPLGAACLLVGHLPGGPQHDTVSSGGCESVEVAPCFRQRFGLGRAAPEGAGCFRSVPCPHSAPLHSTPEVALTKLTPNFLCPFKPRPAGRWLGRHGRRAAGQLRQQQRAAAGHAGPGGFVWPGNA